MAAGDDPLPISPSRSFMDLDTPFTRWLVRWRWVFFVIIGIMIVIPFNGEWRIGLDSALYRGVADNLVAGKGYTFAGLKQTQIYPGLPYLLAGLNKLTGSNSVVPVLILFNLCALATVAGVYLLIQQRFAMWIAVVVACGVGLNVRFIQQAHEVMTDMPFVLAVVAAMLGWEYMGQSVKPGARKTVATGIMLLAFGLLLGVVMRPSFWVLAMALGLTCCWNVIRHREKRSLIALLVLFLVGLTFALADPRVRGMNFLHGGYEREFLSLLGQAGQRAKDAIPRLLTTEIPETFFAETLTYGAIPASILLLAGAAMVWWKRPLWGMQVFIMLGVMLVLSDVPRYLLMVLPTLWLGYLMVILFLTQKLPGKYRDWTLFAMVSLANFQNIAGFTALFHEQHAGNFIDRYRDGNYRKYIAMAELIRQRVPDDAVIVGPHGNVLAYFSGHNVRSGRLIGLEWGAVTRYPKIVAKHNPTYLIGPANQLGTKDKALERLVKAGVIRPTSFVGKIDDPQGSLWLTTCIVVVPETDWRKLPESNPVVNVERPTRRPAFTPEELARRELKAKRERKELRAKRERKAIRAAREAARLNTTQPTTAPGPQSMSIPVDQLGLMWWEGAA